MSSYVLWHHACVPSARDTVEDKSFQVADETLFIPHAQGIGADEKELVTLPDRRAYRAMSRSGLLLAAATLPMAKDLASLAGGETFDIGLYCAIDNGADNYQCAQNVLTSSRETFAADYRRCRGPKDYLKQLPNLAAAHVAIFLGIQGPIHVYTHSRLGSIQALEQAQDDLAHGQVRYAIVCSAFSFEDPLLVFRMRQEAPPGSILREGSASLLLGREGERPLGAQPFREATAVWYAIADPFLGCIERLDVKPTRTLLPNERTNHHNP